MSFQGSTLGVVIFCALAPAAEGAARSESAGASPRMDICLNGMWQVAPGGNSKEVPDAGWKPMRVPALPNAGRSGGNALWYRLSLDVPAEWAAPGRRFFLELEKVGHYAGVYCNRKLAGEHYGQFSPCTVELTDALRTGAANEIAVHVHDASGRFAQPGVNVTDASFGLAYRPAARTPEKRNWIGIVGDVTLSWRPPEHIADVFVTTSVGRKTIEARVEVARGRGPRRRLECRATVLDGDKPVVKLAARDLARGGEPVRLAARWVDPVLWGPPPYGTPKLYILRTELLAGGTVVDRTFTRFGFREVTVRGREVLLNGRKLWMVGTYHFWLDALRYLNDRRVFAAEIRAMQAAGLGCLHGHWDDLGRPWLELCDEMGMLVFASYYCEGQTAVKSSADKPWAEWMVSASRRWARARRAHPSIVIWRPHCGMPKGGDYGGTGAVSPRCAAAIRETDGTRPISNNNDIRDYCQGTDQDPGRVTRALRNFQKPVITNEIWGGLGQAELSFFRTYYKNSYEGGSVGFIVQFLPHYERKLDFRVSWPSLSGPGNRDTSWQVKRGLNWCDPSKPAWKEEAYARTFSELHKQYTGRELGVFNGKTAGELLVSGAGPNTPVFLLPQDPERAPAIGMLSAGDGTAWFVVKRPGKYRLVHGRRSKTVEVEPRFPAAKPGYDYLQRVRAR